LIDPQEEDAAKDGDNNAAKDEKSKNNGESTTAEPAAIDSTSPNNPNNNPSATTTAAATEPKKKVVMERSPSAAAADIRANANANFLAVEGADELEMIELVRRIAELVVLSERKAGQLLEAAASAQKDKSNGGGAAAQSSDNGREEDEDDDGEQDGNTKEAGDEGDGDGDGDNSQQSKGEDSSEAPSASSKSTEKENNKPAIDYYNEDMALPYLALFELFCERNALANIVNIVTGVAFVSNTNNNTSTTNNTTSPTTNNQQREQLLPPLPIATQAVQSVSILIQNVSRATSLYFLLSNNRVNDLINLPLHLYQRAELNALHRRYNEKYSQRGGRSRKGRSQPLPPLSLTNNWMNYQSGEMAELTTHFVSFLKSLAMRVNAETLQFFLSFPLNEKSENTNEEGNSTNNEEEEKEQEQQQKTKLGYLERRKVVEFPLYARALEFCTPEQDSFVRVTAMNVCMNIIRLATVHSEGDEDDEDEDGSESGDKDGGNGSDDEDDDDQQSLPPTDTPSGFLHEAPTLPLQDCIAIAQYACHPQRVADLVSPLCARLTSQFGQVEGTVRALEDLNNAAMMVGEPDNNDDGAASSAPTASTSSSSSQSSQNHNNNSSNIDNNHKRSSKDIEKERQSLRTTVQNVIANVQDELLLLDDLLKVGLISLNEQSIEMMLATFVYPMLLQPLLLPLHRFSSSKRKSEETEMEEEEEVQDDTIVEGVEGDDTGEGSVPQEGGKKEGSLKKETKRNGQPVIVLQSPPPLSSTPQAEEATSTPNNDTVSSGNKTQLDPIDNERNKPQRHSSSEMDLAPSKTALLGLSVIFHTVSNPTFRHLLLTALLHPLSPEASGGAVISIPPQITLPASDKKKGGCVVWSDDFQLEIRMEKNQARISKEREEFQRDVNVYTFGTEPRQLDGNHGEGGDGGVNTNNNEDFTNTCVFILAPALVDMLRNKTATPTNTSLASEETAAMATNSRNNPYRNVLLSSISGADEMVALQPLATAALHAAVSAVDGPVIRTIMFPPSNGGHNSEQTSEAVNDVVNGTLSCLCHGIVSTCVTYDGWWKAKFDTVAARTLTDIISNNPTYIKVASKILEDIRLKAAEFLMTLPNALDAKSRKDSAERDKKNNTSKSGSGNSSPRRSTSKSTSHDGSANQHLETWLLDRFFFDQADRYVNSVVENVCYLKEEADYTNENDHSQQKREQYRYGLCALSKMSIAGTSSLLCDDSMRVIDNNMIVGGSPFAADGGKTSGGHHHGRGGGGNTPFHCAASWALSCLYLDAFCVKVSKLCSVVEDSEGQPERRPSRRLSYIHASGNSSRDDDEVSFSLAHISSKFAIAMLDEGGDSSAPPSPSRSGKADPEGRSITAAPAHGSPVGLVGKAAFPCVCEVSSSFAPLFSGRTCISNEGIQWQSLYLVVVGKWAVLAEPGHGGSGGEGRVITACRLACLAVRKDSSNLVNNKTPARRLLVAHASLDPRPPSLFVVDKSSHPPASSPSSGGPNLGPNGLRLTRSRMDLWFEDANAAAHACRVLSGKIAKARARRGGRIKTALLAR